MTLKERIKNLAQERGISLPALEAELGFGNSTIVKWDKSTPNADKLNAVAKYFGVTMDYLLNGVTVDNELSPRDERDISKSLDHIMSEIKSGADSPLYYNGVEIDDASLNLLQNAIEFALRETKKENKVKYNPNKNKK